MGWMAKTAFDKVAPGTSLHILKSPQVAGQPASALQAGVSLPIEHPSGSFRTTARVVQASTIEAIIEMEDGARWRMTPRAATDQPPSISTAMMHTQDWVVRSAV